MKEKVLVIGAARSGVAVSKLLSLHDYEVTITDMAEIKDKEELIASGMHVFECGHPDHLRNKEWAFVVKNPGIKYTVPFVKYFVDENIYRSGNWLSFCEKISLWSSDWYQWKDDNNYIAL